MEVLRGVREDSQHRKISRIFEAFDYLETDKEIYLAASNIYRTCRAKGFTIRSTIDCIIAKFFPLKVF